MLKKKLSILLSVLMITGCFAQSAFAEEIKNDNKKNATTISETKNNTKVENKNTDKKEQKKSSDNNKISSKKENFPKVDFEILSSEEAFDTEFHSVEYQEKLMNKCLKSNIKIQEYFSQATIITANDDKFSNALRKVRDYKEKTFDNGFSITESSIILKDYNEYKENHKNISKVALSNINKIINQSKATISYAKKQLKENTSKLNKYIQEAQSCGNAENKKDLLNVLIADIMQQYCSTKTQNSINYLKNLSKNNKITLEDIVKSASKNNNSPSNSSKSIANKTTTKLTNTNSPTSAAQNKNTKPLPKTGGFAAAPIASAALIMSGITVGAINKFKKH